MKRFNIFFSILKVPSDFLMTVLGFATAYQLRLITEPIEGIAKPIDYSALPTESEYLIFSVSAAAALVVIFALNKMYVIRTTTKFSRELKKTFLSGFIWVMGIITWFFFTRTFPFSRLAIVYSWIIALLLVISGRWIIRAIQGIFLRHGIGRAKVMFLGNNDVTEEISQNLSLNPSYQILGVADKISDIEETSKKHEIDQIIQTKSDITETQNAKILAFCEENHIDYRFIPDLLEVKRSNIEIETIAGIPIIRLKPTPLDGWGKVIKRITDIFGAITGMILTSPILLLTAIAIKLDSKGPVLFTKLDDGSAVKRVGQKGKLFKFYKFRSMHPNTHNLRYTELAAKNLRKDGPLVKIENDPRITRVGKFIRRYSIDELPALWSVLIGDMSLVGPRPHLPEEVAKYERHHRFLLTIKPGVTGLAQTSGRSDLNFQEEAKLDSYYIENWSWWMDIKIILKTMIVVFRGYQE